MFRCFVSAYYEKLRKYNIGFVSAYSDRQLFAQDNATKWFNGTAAQDVRVW